MGDHFTIDDELEGIRERFKARHEAEIARVKNRQAWAALEQSMKGRGPVHDVVQAIGREVTGG